MQKDLGTIYRQFPQDMDVFFEGVIKDLTPPRLVADSDFETIVRAIKADNVRIVVEAIRQKLIDLAHPQV